MRNVILIVFLLCTAATIAQDETSKLKWLTNLEQAQKIAKKKKQPILMYMTGSDWCAPCKMLKEDFFESDEFFTRSKDMVLVMIDRPRRVDILSEKQLAYNKEVIAKYNKENTFPKILILNANGKEKAKISGYSSLRDTSNHFAFLDKNTK